MTIRRSFLGSLITTKLIIGVTGILLFLYLILHIAGNLMVFLGRETFNTYSHALISNPLGRSRRDRPARRFSDSSVQGHRG